MAAKKKPLERSPRNSARRALDGRERSPFRRSVRPAASSAREPTRCPSWSGCSRRSEGALMANVLAFAESRGGDLRKVALEAVTAARKAADASGGGEVHAFLIGAPGIAAQGRALGRYGADVVVVVEHAALERYSPEVVRRDRRRAHQVGRLSSGVLPRLGPGTRPGAARRGEAGRRLASDVTASRSRATRSSRSLPAYTGKVIVTLRLAGTPAVVSMRPGAVTAAEKPRRRGSRRGAGDGSRRRRRSS